MGADDVRSIRGNSFSSWIKTGSRAHDTATLRFGADGERPILVRAHAPTPAIYLRSRFLYRLAVYTALRALRSLVLRALCDAMADACAAHALRRNISPPTGHTAPIVLRALRKVLLLTHICVTVSVYWTLGALPLPVTCCLVGGASQQYLAIPASELMT